MANGVPWVEKEFEMAFETGGWKYIEGGLVETSVWWVEVRLKVGLSLKVGSRP